MKFLIALSAIVFISFVSATHITNREQNFLSAGLAKNGTNATKGKNKTLFFESPVVGKNHTNATHKNKTLFFEHPANKTGNHSRNASAKNKSRRVFLEVSDDVKKAAPAAKNATNKTAPAKKEAKKGLFVEGPANHTNHTNATAPRKNKTLFFESPANKTAGNATAAKNATAAAKKEAKKGLFFESPANNKTGNHTGNATAARKNKTLFYESPAGNATHHRNGTHKNKTRRVFLEKASKVKKHKRSHLRKSNGRHRLF